MNIRSYKIAKLLIKDKTLMFVEIETEEDFKKIMSDKKKQYKLVDTDVYEKIGTIENDDKNNDDKKLTD